MRRKILKHKKTRRSKKAGAIPAALLITLRERAQPPPPPPPSPRSELRDCKRELELSKRFGQQEKKRADELMKKLSDLENTAINLRSDMSTDDSTKTLEEIEEDIREAMLKCMRDGDDDCEEVDRLDLVLKSHPEYKERLMAQRAAWETSQKNANENALKEMRGIVPENINKTTLTELKQTLTSKLGDSNLADKLAKRIWSKKIIWLIRMPSQMVKKLSIVEFKNKYSPVGLDIVELRAIYYSLPLEFENDGEGKKAAWRESIRSKLEEFVNREQNNSLSPGERRHSAYNGIPREPLFNINMDSRIWSPDAMDPYAN